MKMKLIKRQILDEREEQLVNKAGMGEFQSHAMWQFSFIYGFCSDEWGGRSLSALLTSDSHHQFLFHVSNSVSGSELLQ